VRPPRTDHIGPTS